MALGSEKLSDEQLALLELEPGVSQAEVQAESVRAEPTVITNIDSGSSAKDEGTLLPPGYTLKNDEPIIYRESGADYWRYFGNWTRDRDSLC
jgi:hypothetical protein